MAEENRLPRQEDWRPRPDPTELTSEAISRDISALKELILHELECERELRTVAVMALANHVTEIEKRRIEQKGDAATALDAALQSQRSTADKSERALEKQLEEIKTTVATTIDGLRRELGDLKDRMTTVESTKIGAQEQKAGISTTVGMAIAAGGLILTLVVVAANVLTTQ